MSADEELDAVLDVGGAADEPAVFEAVAVAVVDVADAAGPRDESDNTTAAEEDDGAATDGRATVALGDTFPVTVAGRPDCRPGGAAARGRADRGGRAGAGRAGA